MLLREIIIAACKLRPLFAEAVGYAESDHAFTVKGMPSELAGLYKIAEGTKRNIKDQTLMDIIPGFRLIHHKELQAEVENFRLAYPELSTFYPFLADYASSYYTLDLVDKKVNFVDREHNVETISNNLEQFLGTILTLYNQGVYFLDDGYLDYDFDREAEIGAELNPGCTYWEG